MATTTAHLLRRPSAYLPIAMSFLALCVVLTAVLVFGAGPAPDEGTAAHVFQLLIAGQAPFVLWGVATSIGSHPREAVLVLALQALAAVVAFTPVFAWGL